MLTKALFCVALVVALAQVARMAVDQAHALNSIGANLVALASPPALRDSSANARLRDLEDQARQLANHQTRQTSDRDGNKWRSLACVDDGCTNPEQSGGAQ